MKNTLMRTIEARFLSGCRYERHNRKVSLMRVYTWSVIQNSTWIILVSHVHHFVPRMVHKLLTCNSSLKINAFIAYILSFLNKTSTEKNIKNFWFTQEKIMISKSLIRMNCQKFSNVLYLKKISKNYQISLSGENIYE